MANTQIGGLCDVLQALYKKKRRRKKPTDVRATHTHTHTKK